MSEVSYPLATSSWDGEEYAAIERVVQSGHFSMGNEVALFERKFADGMGSKHALMVNSGSSANLIIIAALRYHTRFHLAPGDEVLVPAVSWSTTYFPLNQYGLRLRFVDIDVQTLNFDLGALEDAITDRTRAILAVNLLGNPNDFDVISDVAQRHDLILLEDNCESLGATLHERQTGTFGLAGSYSSFFSHHISTMEGGMVVTDDEELWHIMLAIRAHGWTRNLPERNFLTKTKGENRFVESFRFILPGYNLRPLEMSGAVGQAQLKKLKAIVAARRVNALGFKRVMEEFPEFLTQLEIGRSSWFGFSLVVKKGISVCRDDLVTAFAHYGIECRPIVAGNFARKEVVKKYIDHTIHGSLKNADLIDQNGLFIGNHHYPLDQQFDVLRKSIAEALGR